MRKSISKQKLIMVALLLIMAVLSMTVLTKMASSPKFHASTIKELDEKKVTVTELTAAAVAASTTLSLLPGDAATPIADQLSKLSSYLLLVLGAVFLEKYLLTITGYLTFKVIVPAICVVLIADIFKKRTMLKTFVIKLGVLGITLMLLIPASVKLSNVIYSTYESSINETIESAKQTQDTIEEKAEGLSEEDANIFSGFFSKIGSGIANFAQMAERMLTNFIEAVIIMVITSCVIPIAALIVFVWIIKAILGADVRKYLSDRNMQIEEKAE